MKQSGGVLYQGLKVPATEVPAAEVPAAEVPVTKKSAEGKIEEDGHDYNFNYSDEVKIYLMENKIRLELKDIIPETKYIWDIDILNYKITNISFMEDDYTHPNETEPIIISCESLMFSLNGEEEEKQLFLFKLRKGSELNNQFLRDFLNLILEVPTTDNEIKAILNNPLKELPTQYSNIQVYVGGSF